MSAHVRARRTDLNPSGLIPALNVFFEMAIGYGCFQGWGWIWTLGMIFAIITLVFSLFTSWARGFKLSDALAALARAIIPAVIISYLNTRDVKAWFGKTV